MHRSLPTILLEVGEQFDMRGTIDMSMPGVSVKEAFLAVAKANYNRNKWMPDLLWVDLVQKILARLLMIFLHFGALTRMLVIQILSDEKKLMQRELAAVYRLKMSSMGGSF